MMAALAQQDGARAVAEQLVPRLLSRATLAQQPLVVKEVREMIERTPVAGIVGALRARSATDPIRPLCPDRFVSPSWWSRAMMTRSRRRQGCRRWRAPF